MLNNLQQVFGASRLALAMSALALVTALGGTAYAAATITSAAIVDNTIQSVDVRDNAITHRDIKDNKVTGADIRDETIQTGDIEDGEVLGPDIGDGQVDSLNLQNGGIQAEDLQPGLVAPRLHAVILADGSIQAGSASASFRNDAGNYSVEFDGIDLTTCAVVVTPTNTPAGSVFLTSANTTSPVDQVVVQIKDGAGGGVDQRFNVAVLC